MKLPIHYRVFPTAGVAEGDSERVEFDAIIIGEWAVYLLDIKHLSGRVMIDPNLWTLEDGRSIRSPVADIVKRTKWFAGWLGAWQQSALVCPWCQPLVVVTGDGVSSPSLSGEGDGLVVPANELIEALTSGKRLTTARPRLMSHEQREAVTEAIVDQGNREIEDWERQWQD